MQNGEAAAYLLDIQCREPTKVTNSTTGTINRDSLLLNQVATYANAVMTRESNASVAIMLANYQKFLVLSACAVLYATNISETHIFEIVRICTGLVSDDYCKRMLRIAVFLNEMIDSLNAKGWGNRASELLLICWSDQADDLYMN
jgi:hypothetical protein